MSNAVATPARRPLQSSRSSPSDNCEQSISWAWSMSCNCASEATSEAFNDRVNIFLFLLSSGEMGQKQWKNPKKWMIIISNIFITWNLMKSVKNIVNNKKWKFINKNHHLFWTFEKHCVRSLRDTVRESFRALLELYDRSARYASTPSVASPKPTMLTPRHFVDEQHEVHVEFLRGESLLYVRHFTAESMLRERCHETVHVFHLILQLRQIPSTARWSFRTCGTYASKFFAVTSAAIILFLLFEGVVHDRFVNWCRRFGLLVCRSTITIRSLRGSLCALGRCPHWRRRRLVSVRSVESWSHDYTQVSDPLRVNEFTCLHGDAATHKSQSRSKINFAVTFFLKHCRHRHVLVMGNVADLPFLRFHLAFRVRVASVGGPHKSEFDFLDRALFFQALSRSADECDCSSRCVCSTLDPRSLLRRIRGGLTRTSAHVQRGRQGRTQKAALHLWYDPRHHVLSRQTCRDPGRRWTCRQLPLSSHLWTCRYSTLPALRTSCVRSQVDPMSKGTNCKQLIKKLLRMSIWTGFKTNDVLDESDEAT